MGEGNPRGQYQGGIKRRVAHISEREAMKLPHRRQFLHLAAGAAALPAVSRVAWAQTYPTRPITMIVPAPAGGPTDSITRILIEHMRSSLGQPIVIENGGGAGGTIAVGRQRAPIPTATRSSLAIGAISL